MRTSEHRGGGVDWGSLFQQLIHRWKCKEINWCMQCDWKIFFWDSISEILSSDERSWRKESKTVWFILIFTSPYGTLQGNVYCSLSTRSEPSLWPHEVGISLCACLSMGHPHSIDSSQLSLFERLSSSFFLYLMDWWKTSWYKMEYYQSWHDQYCLTIVRACAAPVS